MKKTIEKFGKFLISMQLTKAEKGDILPFIQERNRQHLMYGSIILVLVSIAHIIIFSKDLPFTSGKEKLWMQAIVNSHLTLSIFFILTLIYTVFTKKRKQGHSINPQLVPNITFLFLIVIGAAIASFDQLVLTAITPFVIVCIATPLAFTLSPFITFFYYLIGLIAFFTMIPYYQPNEEVLQSHIVNALTIVSVGYFISLTMWINLLSRLRNTKVIEQQKQLLKEQNDELLQIADELKNSNSLKDKLFSIIAHDLRNPFNVMISSSEMLLDDAANYTHEEQEVLKNNIRLTASNTYLLLQNLLEWSQLQRNKVSLNLQRTNLSLLISESTADFSHSLKNKNIHLEKSIGVDPVMIDPVLIASVVRNLLSNAIKFTPKNGRILLQSYVENNRIIIRIIDTGKGMTSEMVQNLFNEQYKSSREGTEGEKSTGIGLQLVKEFVELHKGSVFVESTPEVGSTFTVSLPHIS